MLTAVGLGPGDRSLLAPAARLALERAEMVVGYTKYMELVPPELLAEKRTIATGMTGEVDRARRAVEAAAQGLRTVVVCSGDAGVYAMAGLLMEVLEAEGLAKSVPFEVVPGIPAFVAAAALLGAPLMHDFASVSLSDLLTPWETIAERIECAARADFVIAIYNPRSKKRSGHLEKALELIGKYRDSNTPVGRVSRAYRPGQEVEVVPLGRFDPSVVDMQTVLVVGNSSTRMLGDRMVTPRGYQRKYSLGPDGGK